MKFTSKSRRMAAAACFAAVLGGSTFAFTASNTVPTSKAGFGSNTITGYAANSVHYGLNSTDPSKIDNVSFKLDTVPAAGSVIKAQLSATGAWFSCTVPTAITTAAVCDTSAAGPTVASATQLSVVAAD